MTICYREHWFWIGERDLNSKGIFSFLMFLFTLSETGGGGGAPGLESIRRLAAQSVPLYRLSEFAVELQSPAQDVSGY